MPRGFAFSRRLTRDQEMNATRLCDGQSSNYSALSRRSASRFGYEASETYESGSFEGALVMRDVASAKRFMAQARAASLRCVNRPSAGSDHRVVSARIAVPGKWEESLGVATERRTPAGKPTNESYGSVAMLARKGRSIVAVKGWMMYAKPVAHRSEIRGFALPPRLAKVLGTLPR